MAETMTKAPGICLTPREVKRELRRMDGFTPPGAEAPAVAHLTGIQLYEVERMAAQGMLLDQIAARLAIPADVFEAISQANSGPERGGAQTRIALSEPKSRKWAARRRKIPAERDSQ